MCFSYYLNYTVGLWCPLEVVSNSVAIPARLEWCHSIVIRNLSNDIGDGNKNVA